jgi:hypothetical protein
MRSITRVAGVLLAIALAMVALPIDAAEGRYPVWQSNTLIGPGQEGQYILTRNIWAQPGAPAIDIQPGTMAVEIDLNGFTIYTSDLPGIHAVGADSVVIRNGTIIGMSDVNLIDVFDTTKLVVEDVKLEWALDSPSPNSAIYATSVKNVALRRNIVWRTAGDGFYLEGAAATTDPGNPITGIIEDNVIKDTGQGIVLMEGSSVDIVNNRIEKTLTHGIAISPSPQGGVGCFSCLVAKNTISNAGRDGLNLKHFEVSKLHNNVVFKSAGMGIYVDFLSQDNLILDNVSGQNGGHGMQVDAPQNHVERNTLNTNGLGGSGFGLLLNGSANTYRGNTAQGNVSGVCPGPGPATTDFCDATAGANNSIGDNYMPVLL